MKNARKRPAIKHRPLDLAVDFLVSTNSDSVEPELAFLSRDIENEFEGEEHVALTSATFSGRHGWTIFRIGKWEHQPALEGRKVVISGVNEEFRREHSGHVLIQRVRPPPLETVVFKVSELDYDIVADDQDAFEKLHMEGIVLRAGRNLELNDVRLEITLCEPVRQGLLGEDTEIILVTDTEEKRAITNGFGTPFSFTSQNESGSDLDIMQFLSLPSSEDDIEYPPETAETSTLVPPVDDATSRGIPLRVVVLQQPVDKYSLDPRPADSEDPEFRVYAHIRDIARIGVFSGDWVAFTRISKLITDISPTKILS